MTLAELYLYAEEFIKQKNSEYNFLSILITGTPLTSREEEDNEMTYEKALEKRRKFIENLEKKI